MTYSAKQIAAVEPLLAFIRGHEARGDFDAVWAKINPADRMDRPLTTMTVGEVLDWQDSIDRKYMSEAAGAYQILEDTLRKAYGPAGLTRTSMFDRRGQDQLAYHLLVGRGLQRYLDGAIRAESFCNALAQEWASLPVVSDVLRKMKDGTERLVRRGQSYYAGDGLNRSLIDADSFLAIVTALRPAIPVIDAAPKPPNPQTAGNPVVPATPPSGGFFMRLIRALFGG